MTTATRHGFRTHAFLGLSLDGFIARPDGDLAWLEKRGEEAGDTGYDAFIAGIDTLVMGRDTYEKVLTFGFWPYEGRRVEVLSTSLHTDDPRITVHRDFAALVAALTARGARNVYADGGKVVQTFLRAGLLDRLTLTHAPVLIGRGIPLFGDLAHDVELTRIDTQPLGAGFVQSTYEIPSPPAA
jgi:dihydrofolate reductase